MAGFSIGIGKAITNRIRNLTCCVVVRAECAFGVGQCDEQPPQGKVAESRRGRGGLAHAARFISSG
jgi:hypothetical protein